MKYGKGSEADWAITRALTALEAAEDKADMAATAARGCGWREVESTMGLAREALRESRRRLERARETVRMMAERDAEVDQPA